MANVVDRPHRHRRRTLAASSYGILLLVVALVTPPVLWIASTSLKTPGETIAYPPQWIPNPVTFDNFIEVTGTNAPRFFFNTAVIGLGSIVLVLLVAVPAAYASVRFRFRGREALMTAILTVSMIPGIAVLIALYGIFIRTSLINTYPLLILVYAGMISGQAVWFVRSFIEHVPEEVEEAAQVDGCDQKRVMWHIVIPLIRPGLAAVSIYVFIFVWNDFLVGSLLTTTEEMRTVQVGLVRFLETGFGAFWGLFGAYVLMAFTPVIVLFLAFQRWFIAGLTSGAVKG